MNDQFRNNLSGVTPWQQTGSTIITVQFPALSDMLGGRRSVRQLAFQKKRPNPA